MIGVWRLGRPKYPNDTDSVIALINWSMVCIVLWRLTSIITRCSPGDWDYPQRWRPRLLRRFVKPLIWIKPLPLISNTLHDYNRHSKEIKSMTRLKTQYVTNFQGNSSSGSYYTIGRVFVCEVHESMVSFWRCDYIFPKTIWRHTYRINDALIKFCSSSFWHWNI